MDHLQVFDMRTRGLKESTEPGHPIRTLVEEHDMILGFLDMLLHVHSGWSCSLRTSILIGGTGSALPGRGR